MAIATPLLSLSELYTCITCILGCSDFFTFTFTFTHITGKRERFAHAIKAMGFTVLRAVLYLVENPPTDEPYTTLKGPLVLAHQLTPVQKATSDPNSLYIRPQLIVHPTPTGRGSALLDKPVYTVCLFTFFSQYFVFITTLYTTGPHVVGQSIHCCRPVSGWRLSLFGSHSCYKVRFS